MTGGCKSCLKIRAEVVLNKSFFLAEFTNRILRFQEDL